MEKFYLREPIDDSMLADSRARMQMDCPHDPPCEKAIGGYQYYDASFKPLTATSMPLNHEEAFDYFHDISARGANWKPALVARRTCHRHSDEYKMLPVFFKSDTGELLRKET